MTMTETNVVKGVKVHLPSYDKHIPQTKFVDSPFPRNIIRAGRRGGKTTGIAIRMVKRFLEGRRQSYATPTVEQVEACWFEVCSALREPIDVGYFKKNEPEHTIERPGTKQRIKCRTVWNADSMRGDFGDDLYFDEWQLCDEGAWEEVGMPMLADHADSTATFIYTPSSMHSTGTNKSKDPRHAAKMFKKAEEEIKLDIAAGRTPRWATFHFTSHENPYISQKSLDDLFKDMSKQSYRQEILAEDDDIQLSWLVYGSFNEAICKIPRFTVDKSWPRYVFHDFGTANPAALVVAQNPSTADFIVEYEYLPGAGRAIHDRVTDMQALTEGKIVLGRIGGNHQEDEIRQAYAAHNWPISEPKINSVKLQIDRVRAMMDLNKIKVFSDCTRLLEEIMSCLFKPDMDGHPTDDVLNEKQYHLLACSRYGFSDFRPETVTRSLVSVSLPKWRM